MTGDRLPLGSALAGAIVVALVRPLAWGLGLVSFLAGGGLVLLAVPILVLPTPTGLQNLLGGPLTSLVFGIPAGGLVALLAGTVAGVALVLAAAVGLEAWAERRGVAVALEAGAEEAICAAAPLDGAPGVGPVTTLRLAALLPPVLVLMVAARQIYDVTYRELILPEDLATPLPLRVVFALPVPVLSLVLAWLLADSAAAFSVRHLLLERSSVLRAWVAGWVALVRRPVRVLGASLFGLFVLAILLGPALAASAVGWAKVRDILLAERDPGATLLAVVVWVAIWLGSLVLAAVAAAVRASAFTLAAASALSPASQAPGPASSDASITVPTPGS